MNHKHDNGTLGWGTKTDEGLEIWDAKPVFSDEAVTWKHKLMLVFYPKKWFLYRAVGKAFRKHRRGHDRSEPFRVLDVGCGTGGTLIDFKKLFGRESDVVGLDVVHMLIDIAKTKAKHMGVHVQVDWYDGTRFPYDDNSFDAVYASDVLGHVPDVDGWLSEIARVLKPGGTVAMFSESALGKHAFIRNYLFERGLNIDPHEEFHISLYGKSELKEKFQQAGFKITDMRTAFWASFFVHPDEFYEKLQGQPRFLGLKLWNALLYKLKKASHPFSTAMAELYGTVEMYAIGKWVEAQGYIIIGKKL